MSLAPVLAITIGIPLLGIQALFIIALWQRKEYRWDRMRSYLGSEGLPALSNPYIAFWLGWALLGWLLFLFGLERAASFAGWVALLSPIPAIMVRIRRQGIA
ncbi:MAG: hypothetical protein ACRD4B_07740, partial [Acidobacteriota bacterium]